MGHPTAERRVTLTQVHDLVIYTRLYLAVGAALWAYTLALLLGQTIDLVTGVIVAATVFGLYAVNRLSDLTEDEYNIESASRRRARGTFVAGVGALFCAVAVSLWYDPVLLLPVGVIVVLGIAYSVAVIPVGRYRRLKEVPIGKNVTVATGWTVLLCGMVLVATGAGPSGALAVLALFVFVHALVGSVIPDVGDVAGDRQAGIRTIPIQYGLPATKRVLYVATAVVTVVFYAAIVVGALPRAAVLPGVVNFLGFPLITALDEENARLLTVLDEVSITYLFCLLTIVSVGVIAG